MNTMISLLALGFISTASAQDSTESASVVEEGPTQVELLLEEAMKALETAREETAKAGAEAKQAKMDADEAKKVWEQMTSEAASKEAKAQKAAKKSPKTEYKIGGKYVIWALNQNNFLLGKDHPLDDARYTVQMLRTNFKASRKHSGIVARFDAAQGWWGVNNSSNYANTTSLDGDGALVNGTSYNNDKMFGNKDTNYGIHFDYGYGWAEFNDFVIPFRVQAGRQYFKVGNKLVLDQNLDGVQLSSSFGEASKVTGMWAKVSEGIGSYKSPKGLLMSDKGKYADATLYGLVGDFGKVTKGKGHHVQVFALHYRDQAATDWTYLPQGLGYTKSRFSPNISQLTVLGVAADGRFGTGFTYKAEGDFLFGKDSVNNDTYGGGTLDQNNGSLSGYNAYLNVVKTFASPVPVDLGGTFGMGSGDPDGPTGGKGNVNKIQTMGFFPLTNVWEDSVMPDLEGISPQGLGSPVSRGYRELENTTVIQAKAGVKPLKTMRLEASYTYLMATQAIYAFDAAGTPGTASARDIGSEVDANVIVKFRDGNLIYKGLFGYFMPGTASQYLINGTSDFADAAWEFKQVFVVKF